MSTHIRARHPGESVRLPWRGALLGVVDQFRAMLAAVRSPEPWTPGSGQDVAVRIGPVHRARPPPAR
ncbi:hypothetical protein [Streptomyces virginiae]|uniref:hypothetical protein n=1 Tax=Streptomyces virginiae TaxID=1961 RepID=UPI002DBD80CA|nr:hypothetical protein [Streptomyces sp. CMAA1738]MEC4574236.1 hypothetical protein [Streptomyces sp. CMAA1738]